MEENRNYLVVDESGEVVNIILWDGETQYDPGEGRTVLVQPEGVGIGWRRDGDGWTAPDDHRE